MSSCSKLLCFLLNKDELSLYSRDIGQLVFFFRGVGALEAKRFKIGGVSFRVISSPINGARGNGFLGSWDQNCGVQTKNGDFLAISGL